MFTLEDEVIEQNREVEIKLGDKALTLILRPVSDDERMRDSALHHKFIFEDDPDKAVAFFVARNDLKKSLVIGWKGIETPDGKLVPFTEKNFQRLLKSKAVRSLVVDAVDDHFNGKIAEAELGKLRGLSQDSSPGGLIAMKDSQLSLNGTAGESQPENLRQD